LGRREIVIPDGSTKNRALIMKVHIAAVGEVGHKEIWIRIIAIGDAEDCARGARDTGFRKVAVHRELGTIRAFCNDLKTCEISTERRKKIELDTHLRDI
jgi:hypothetical protein